MYGGATRRSAQSARLPSRPSATAIAWVTSACGLVDGNLGCGQNLTSPASHRLIDHLTADNAGSPVGFRKHGTGVPDIVRIWEEPLVHWGDLLGMDA